MNKILILLSLIFLTSCWGGSRKMKVYESVIVAKIVPDEKIYCKYFGVDGVLERRFKFIDTCGKFKIGDTVHVNFYK